MFRRNFRPFFLQSCFISDTLRTSALGAGLASDWATPKGGFFLLWSHSVVDLLWCPGSLSSCITQLLSFSGCTATLSSSHEICRWTLEFIFPLGVRAQRQQSSCKSRGSLHHNSPSEMMCSCWCAEPPPFFFYTTVLHVQFSLCLLSLCSFMNTRCCYYYYYLGFFGEHCFLCSIYDLTPWFMQSCAWFAYGRLMITSSNDAFKSLFVTPRFVLFIYLFICLILHSALCLWNHLSWIPTSRERSSHRAKSSTFIHSLCCCGLMNI